MVLKICKYVGAAYVVFFFWKKECDDDEEFRNCECEKMRHKKEI